MRPRSYRHITEFFLYNYVWNKRLLYYSALLVGGGMFDFLGHLWLENMESK